MLVNLFFYFFSCVLLTSSLMVILSQNSIYSVLFLVLSFISSSSLLFLLECEYISLVFIIIYVGAIAVLFLFVVMMLDIKTAYLAKDSLKYFPFGSFLGVIFLIEILIVVPGIFESINPYSTSFLFNSYSDWVNKLDYFTEIVSIGHLLYTDYVIQFLLSGNILLLATIGPVTLVLVRTIESTKKQITFKQLSRNYTSILLN
jgi:NADH-quinone oxidoreductase subunit J|uniref:NADH-ubiquinone oxidoreductase chain 6 n=1 Tax=Thalassiosira rotula TaxID=49265 RepID=A0A8B0SII4_9STRA|nr:NADH dehydrogenase subunit 6 [Thalassiosira rotula]QTX08922.1 NADH dehydrogenase subunit 6 [Thalassiosira rotula]